MWMNKICFFFKKILFPNEKNFRNEIKSNFFKKFPIKKNCKNFFIKM